jgi:cysteine synthase A
MKIFNNAKELVGNTPTMKFNNINFPSGVNLYGKLEILNPGGSMKDRMGLSMLADAEKSGRLKSGGHILEVTAGNTGIGIAFAAVGKGYKITYCVPMKFSQEKQYIMRILGADIINTPEELGMQGSFDKAEELLKEHPDWVYLKQFENPANTEGYYGLGEEIYNDLDGDVDYLVCGAGTGGTICGAGKILKEKNPKVKIILADPYGSIMGGGECGHYKIEGIGNGFMPKTMDSSLVDEVYKIKDEEAFDEIKLLAKQEGILAGSSTGAAIAGARKLAEKYKKGNIVVIVCDRGDRYLSKKIFD